jgi:23S rRNA (pseudouridine1915-N3)-methyltransferase
VKCIVPLLGRTKEAYLAAGIEDFAGRLRRFAQLELPLLREQKRTASQDPRRLAREEGEALLRILPRTARIVALAPEGRQLSSEEFAALLGRWQDEGGRETAFLIGGPTGHTPELLAQADCVLSLSRMTFTHEMARLLLLEQLYRAFAIRAGTGYHK